MRLTGSVEEVLHKVAGLVSDQQRQIDELKQQLTAHQFMMRDVVVPLLGFDGPLHHETWTSEVERATKFWRDASAAAASEEVAKAFSQIADTVEWYHHTPGEDQPTEPSPRFTIITGGKG